VKVGTPNVAGAVVEAKLLRNDKERLRSFSSITPKRVTAKEGSPPGIRGSGDNENLEPPPPSGEGREGV